MNQVSAKVTIRRYSRWRSYHWAESARGSGRLIKFFRRLRSVAVSLLEEGGGPRFVHGLASSALVRRDGAFFVPDAVARRLQAPLHVEKLGSLWTSLLGAPALWHPRHIVNECEKRFVTKGFWRFFHLHTETDIVTNIGRDTDRVKRRFGKNGALATREGLETGAQSRSPVLEVRQSPDVNRGKSQNEDSSEEAPG